MTRTLTACCGLFLVAVAAPAAAQAPGTRAPVPHQQQITANPFGVIGGWFNAEYERKLAETWSVGLGGSYLSLDDNESISSASAAFRFYPQGAALSSFYVGPRVGFYRQQRGHVHTFTGMRVDEVNDNPESSLGVGFELGYTWLLGADRNFNVSVGVGATRLFSGGVVPTGKLLNIGWAF